MTTPLSDEVKDCAVCLTIRADGSPNSGSVAKLCPQACRAMIVVGLATERSTVVDFKGSHFERVIVLWGVRLKHPLIFIS